MARLVGRKSAGPCEGARGVATTAGFMDGKFFADRDVLVPDAKRSLAVRRLAVACHA